MGEYLYGLVIFWQPPLPTRFFAGFIGDTNEGSREEERGKNERKEDFLGRRRFIDGRRKHNYQDNIHESRGPALPRDWRPTPAEKFALEPISLGIVLVVVHEFF